MHSAITRESRDLSRILLLVTSLDMNVVQLRECREDVLNLTSGEAPGYTNFSRSCEVLPRQCPKFKGHRLSHTSPHH